MVGEMIHFGANVHLTRSLPQVSPIDRVYRFNMPMVYPCDGDDVHIPARLAFVIKVFHQV
jgi:hypothetical protein